LKFILLILLLKPKVLDSWKMQNIQANIHLI
jgi:hypothetical protein